MSYKAEVTEDCAGTGQCVLIAPAIFELDSDGLSTVIDQPDSSESLELATAAAEMCPMAAIRLTP